MRSAATTKEHRIACLLLAALLSASMASAAPLQPEGLPDHDQVLVNSQDWRDVFSGLLYARLAGKNGDYILSPEAAIPVVLSLDKGEPRVLVVEPRRERQYANIAGLLEDEGFIPEEVPGSGPIGLRLASALPVRGVIVTDERYPYNAVSLAPYAILNQEFVLFADATNIDEVVSLIEMKDVPVTIYGLVDARVRDSLAPFEPSIIDEGGKFDNNLYVVKAFMESRVVDQVVITNGEFIEQGIIDDFNPVLFLGRERVPPQVEEFLRDAPVSHGVVVGNYLADTASALKDRLASQYGKEFFLVVKFARSPRVVTSRFAVPSALEYFPLPIIDPELAIASVAFNRLTGRLEVTYSNPSAIPVFFSSSFSLESLDEAFSVGDEDAQSIAPGQRKTILYEADVTSLEGLAGVGVVTYGDYPSSLEYSFTEEFPSIPVIAVDDDALITIKDVVYDRADDAFFVTLRNPGDVAAYVNVELVDVVVDGLPTTLGTKKTVRLGPGETVEVYLRAKLSRLDILENEELLVRAYYGEREQVLFKVAEEWFPMRTRLVRPSYAVGAIIVLALVILALLFLFCRKRTYTCDRCGERVRARRMPRRHRCGGRFS